MDELYVLMFLIGMIVSITFLGMATFAYKKGNGKAKRRYILSGIFAIIAVLGIYGLSRDLPDQQTEAKKVGAVNTQNEVVEEATNTDSLFDMKPSSERSSPQSANDFNGIVTIDEFKDNFKKVINENTLSVFNIDNLEIKEEPSGGGTFNLMIKETIALTGAFNSDRKIEITSLLVTGDGTETTGKDILITMGMFIIATNPSYSISDAEEVLMELGMDQNNMEKIKNGSSVIRNGIRYSMNFVKDTNVVMLSARSANDN